MTHYMKLAFEPFQQILTGLKTIELRLNDEKRQKIKVGDIIVFCNVQQPEQKLTAKVINLYNFATFADLYLSLPLEKCGYLPEQKSSAKYTDMYKYYTKEEEKRFGVLGIEISIVSI